MIVFKKIFSIFASISIEIQRYTDHTWRRLTGLPALKKSMITPQLFLGGQYTHRGYMKLNKMGVTAIVNMREQKNIPYELKGNIKILHLPTLDRHAPSISNLKKGIQFMTNEIQNGGKIYVHCHAGEGRGPSMVLAYLMSTGILLEDAYEMVKKIRPFIRITPPQMGVLKQLEKDIHGVSTN